MTPKKLKKDKTAVKEDTVSRYIVKQKPTGWTFLSAVVIKVSDPPHARAGSTFISDEMVNSLDATWCTVWYPMLGLIGELFFAKCATKKNQDTKISSWPRRRDFTLTVGVLGER